MTRFSATLACVAWLGLVVLIPLISIPLYGTGDRMPRIGRSAALSANENSRWGPRIRKGIGRTRVMGWLASKDPIQRSLAPSWFARNGLSIHPAPWSLVATDPEATRWPINSNLQEEALGWPFRMIGLRGVTCPLVDDSGRWVDAQGVPSSVPIEHGIESGVFIWWPGVLANLTLGPLAILGVARAIKAYRRIRAEWRIAGGLCPHCEYDRQNLRRGVVCPECGRLPTLNLNQTPTRVSQNSPATTDR
ncbi:MAG: hypothetical protein ACK4WH_06025 [Phycisphaerales bacterium]